MNPTNQSFQSNFQSSPSPRQSSPLFLYIKQLFVDLTRARWALLTFLILITITAILKQPQFFQVDQLRPYKILFGYLITVAEVAVAALMFSNPAWSRNEGRFLLFLQRALLCITILLVSYCVVYVNQFSDTPYYNSEGASYLFQLMAPAARIICLKVAIGALVGTAVGGKWLFWSAVVLAPLLDKYINKFCEWVLPGSLLSGAEPYLYPSEFLNLGISAALFLTAFMLWHPKTGDSTGTTGSIQSALPPEPQPGSEASMGLYDIFRNDLRRALWPFFILCLVQGLSLAVSATPSRTLLGPVSLLAQYASAVALAVVIFNGTLDKQSLRYSRRLFGLRAGLSILLCCLPPVVFMSLIAVMQAVSLNSSEVYFIVALQLVGWVSAYCMTAGAGAIIASFAHRNIRQYWFLVFTFSVLIYGARWLIADLLPRNFYGRASEVNWTVFLTPFQVITFAIAIGALVYGYKRLNRRSSRVALGANELQDLTLRQELFRKELQLQRTNLMFTLAATLLGFIGITMAHGAGQEIMGFSTADIRVGIFSVMLAPVLTIILPIMIGSTAAASERAMGVWLWQGALPVSWRRVIWTKVLVVGGLCLAVAGVLPYLLQLTMLDEMPVRMIYRDSWPLWVALLCAAIGFCSGSISRDDYQGLLVSIVPLGLIIGVMYLADPNGLVLPFIVGFDEPFIREWSLAARMILISMLFMWTGAILLKQSGQPWWRRAAAHALIICAATFALTLWNVVTERSLVNGNFKKNPPLVLAEKAKRPKFKLLGHLDDSPAMNTSFDVLEQDQFGISHPMLGSIGRRNSKGSLWTTSVSSQPFIISFAGQLREFPQAVSRTVQAVSPDGQWILSGQPGTYASQMSSWDMLETMKAQISGPMGLAIPFRWLPESLQIRVLNWPMTFQYEEHHVLTYSNAGARDLELTVKDSQSESRLIWENGKLQLPEKLWKSKYVFKGGPNSAYIFQWPPIDEQSTTVSVILAPVQGTNRGVLAGWARGEADGVTEDFRWAYQRGLSHNDFRNNTITLAELKPYSHYDDYCCKGRWMNPAISVGESSGAGTSTSLLLNPDVKLPVVFDGDTRVIITPYYRFDPNQGGDEYWKRYKTIEMGLLLNDTIDPTRNTKIIIDNLQLSGQEPLRSPFARHGAMIHGIMSNALQWKMKPITGNKKAIVVTIENNVAVIYNPAGDWFKEGSWKLMHVAAREDITSSLLLSEDKYVLGTMSDLWMLDLAEIKDK